MKYLIAIETIEIVESEGETEEAAIEAVRAKLSPQKALSATFKIIQDSEYDEELESYKTI